METSQARQERAGGQRARKKILVRALFSVFSALLRVLRVKSWIFQPFRRELGRVALQRGPRLATIAA